MVITDTMAIAVITGMAVSFTACSITIMGTTAIMGIMGTVTSAAVMPLSQPSQLRLKTAIPAAQDLSAMRRWLYRYLWKRKSTSTIS
jgi:hypothetical protein